MTKRSTVVRKLDSIFSKYIRLKYAKAGKVDCYTCGVVKSVSEMQAGHFQSRAKYSVRWDEDNVRPQCAGCNMRNGGQQYVFGQRLNEERSGLADEIVQKSNQIRKFSTPELLEMYDDFRERVLGLSSE